MCPGHGFEGKGRIWMDIMFQNSSFQLTPAKCPASENVVPVIFGRTVNAIRNTASFGNTLANYGVANKTTLN